MKEQIEFCQNSPVISLLVGLIFTLVGTAAMITFPKHVVWAALTTATVVHFLGRWQKRFPTDFTLNHFNYWEVLGGIVLVTGVIARFLPQANQSRALILVAWGFGHILIGFVFSSVFSRDDKEEGGDS